MDEPRPSASAQALLQQRVLQRLLGNPQPMPSHVNEDTFQQWYAGQAKQHDLGPDPDDPQQFYDYRGAFQAGATPDTSGHWPSRFKREGHPNMVVGGFHVKTGARVPGTPQATTDELVQLGWDQTFARQHGRKP